MEQIRLLLAVVLALIVFLTWSYFFGPKPVKQAPTDPVESGQTTADRGFPPQEATNPPVPATPAKPPLEVPAANETVEQQAPSREITVETPLYRAVFSTRGAGLVRLVLKKYRETTQPDSPEKELVLLPSAMETLTTSMADNSIPGLARAAFETDLVAENLFVDASTKNLVFTWTSPVGVAVTKIYTFSPGSYVIGMDVSIKNQSDAAISDRLTVSLKNSLPNVSSYAFEGPLVLTGHSLEEVDIGDIEENPLYTGKIRWTGITGRYFLSALVPIKEKAQPENGAIPTKTEEGSVYLSTGKDSLVVATYIHPTDRISPGEERLFTHKAFFGPKSIEILKESGMGLANAVDYGFFDIIAKPCLYLMNWLYSVIPNYGVAIIILTIIIKILFWPLANKSYQSMNEMKKLQPLMQEIREKYKDDKKRMNEEIFGLYKTYKVNPAGGCLPMLLQIPVFFALYRMLYGAIELRHAPFFLWINDLSAPDRLGNFDITIPLMQAPYGIPVLTLVMGATMFLQQKMSPPPGDRAQAKMMMALPIVFTFIFINFPSGLVLYWLVNNVLSIAQQRWVMKKSA